MKASQVNDQYVDLLRTNTPATPSSAVNLPYAVKIVNMLTKEKGRGVCRALAAYEITQRPE
jgi:hypothetical protein